MFQPGSPIRNRVGHRRPRQLVHMPLLSVTAEADDQLEADEMTHQSHTPGRRAFAARRKIAAMRVMAGKAEPHRHDRDALGIKECVLADPEPVAQPVS